MFPIEIRTRTGLACFSELLAQRRRPGKRCHPAGKSGDQGFPGIRLHQDPTGLIEIVGGPAPGSGDDRQTRCHGFQHNSSTAFEQAWQYKYVRLLHSKCAGFLGEKARELNNRAQPKLTSKILPALAHRSVPDNFKRYAKLTIKSLHRLENDVDSFPVDQASNKDESNRVARLTDGAWFPY